MIINSLLHQESITRPITKSVEFFIMEGTARNRYSQAYAKGLSPTTEKIQLTIAHLTAEEKDSLEALFLEQDTDQFIGFVLPNESVEKPFYPPSQWQKQEQKIQKIGFTEIRYNITFELISYYA